MIAQVQPEESTARQEEGKEEDKDTEKEDVGSQETEGQEVGK